MLVACWSPKGGCGAHCRHRRRSPLSAARASATGGTGRRRSPVTSRRCWACPIRPAVGSSTGWRRRPTSAPRRSPASKSTRARPAPAAARLGAWRRGPAAAARRWPPCWRPTPAWWWPSGRAGVRPPAGPGGGGQRHLVAAACCGRATWRCAGPSAPVPALGRRAGQRARPVAARHDIEDGAGGPCPGRGADAIPRSPGRSTPACWPGPPLAERPSSGPWPGAA